MNSRSWVSIEALSVVSAALKRRSKLLPVRIFLSFACTIARRLPGVWWRNSTTRHGSPSNTRTIPRRICVAGKAIRQILGKTYIALKGSRLAGTEATAGSGGRKGRSQRFPHVTSHDPLSSDVGVQAVRLVQIRNASNAVQEERHKGRPLFPGKIPVHGLECRRVLRPEVGRSFHLDEEYPGLWLAGLYAVQNCRDVCACLGDR